MMVLKPESTNYKLLLTNINFYFWAAVVLHSDVPEVTACDQKNVSCLGGPDT